MVNLNGIIKIAFLFLCLITFINGKDTEWVKYNPASYSAEYKHTTGEKVQSVALEFGSEREIPLYVKVTVTPNENTPTPLLCFSQEGASCNDGREILYKKTDEKAAMIYIKKEQFEKKDLYILVTCEEAGCGYTLTFDGSQVAEIDPNSVFSYLVSSNNREMRFSAIGEVKEGSFLTIGVEGSSYVQILIDDDEGSSEQYKFDSGRIVTLPIVNNTNSNILATFTIKGANTGEFLNLNVHVVYEEKAADNLLYPNGPEVMGLLSGQAGYFREECFPIPAFAEGKYSNVNKYFLTARIHSKYALFWLADENGMYMEETEKEIKDGLLSYMIETNGLKRSVCFEFSYEEEVKMYYVAYSLSILEVTKMESIYNFYLPQTMGQTYRRIIPKGKYAAFNPADVVKSDKKLNYYMYNRKGVAEMYTYTCLSYPDCSYDISTIQKFNHPKRTSKMTVYDFAIDKDYSALSPEKPVMIVYCKDDDNENNGYCEVDVTFNTPGKTIVLVENEQFSKYVLNEEKGTFKIDFKGGVRIQILIVDIMIYSGDVTFNAKGFDNVAIKPSNGQLREEIIDISYYKYYLSNKIVYYFNMAQVPYELVELDYTAKLNSFFTIKYSYEGSNFIQLKENILSGESYLVEIDPTTSEKNKTVLLPNYRTKKEKSFLANFFELNCEFKVTRKEKEDSTTEKEIEFSDGYAQEILNKSSSGYSSENYQYNIKILEADLSNYNHKMCMIYVAGYETSDDDSITEIVVGENINQQVIFNNDFRTIRFLYPLADPSKELAIYANIIDQAYYNIKFYSNSNTSPFKQYSITRSQIFYLSESEIISQCNKDTLCNIIVEAQYTKNIIDATKTTEPMIEITIRQIKNTPTYLQKSQAKRDFTCGDSFYYLYTDIGKNEIGEVSVNFLRDFGNVWGKVVRKDKTDIDQEANWRGIYRMPSADWGDSLPFNGYTKRFEIGIEDTQDCIEGCYLLLSIQISQIGDYVEDFKFYPFSIITRITPNNYAFTDIPKVVIQVNEYIIGNVDVSKNERIYQFYEIWLPHDATRVDFDFQSEVAGLYINVGGIRPTTKNADFALLPPGRDSILSIDKYYIMLKAQEKKIKIPHTNSLEDLNLVIGVWTDKTDSIDTEVFSLTVRLPNEDLTLDIIEVNTDQKVLCKPITISNNQYSCLFMITYDDQDVDLNMPLIIHAASVNQSALTYTYGSYIERKYYDEYDVEKLKGNTPTSQTAKYSTQNSGLEYIYTKLKDEGGQDHYFFVNVISDKQEDIFILTSMPMYNDIASSTDQFYPNPSTEQLLSVSKDKLRLKFFTTSSLIVNFVTLGGEGEIAWADDPNTVFNLRGIGDRLSMTSGKTSDEIIITKRKVQNSNEVDSGFFFYVSYYIRNLENNFDEVQFGKSVELSYRETDLPVFLYSKINSYFNDLNIAVTFRDSEVDTGGEFSVSPMTVKAALAKESTVYKAKQNPELSPTLERSIDGSYDPALRTAIVYLPSTSIKNFNIKSEDNPTLYLSLAKNENAPEKNYEKFNVEAQFSKVNGALIPVEKSFNYGRHTSYYVNYYRLKVDKNKKFMVIEIAFNSNYLNFAVNIAMTRYNASNLILKTVSAKGKTKVLVDNKAHSSDFIYLNIFRVVNKENAQKLYNYAFKYINIANEDEFQDFNITDDNAKLDITEKTNDDGTTTIDCSFNKIKLEKDQANITYFFKVVENSTHYYGEEINTIAVMESPYHTVYKRNPEDNNGKITLSATGDLANWCYLQVIAQIQQDTFIEYVAYDGIKKIRDPPHKDSESSGGINTTVFVVVAVILLALIAGLAVVVFIFQQKNKSLMNQVKHVSFQQNAGAINTSSTDPNLLLQKNQTP